MTLTQQLSRLNARNPSYPGSDTEAVALANTLHALLVEAEGALAGILPGGRMNYSHVRAILSRLHVAREREQPMDKCCPDSNCEGDSPPCNQPQAWSYFMATSYNAKSGEHGDFRFKISQTKPVVPEGAIRELRALYYGNAQPDTRHARACELLREAAAKSAEYMERMSGTNPWAGVASDEMQTALRQANAILKGEE